MDLKLVRRYKGRLVRTPAARSLGGDPVALWTHIAAHLPTDKSDAEVIAAAARLLWVATAPSSGADQAEEDISDAMRPLFRMPDGSALQRSDITWLGGGTEDVLRTMGAERTRLRPDLLKALAVAAFKARLDQRPAARPAGAAVGADPVACHTLRIVLRDVEPPVWRLVRIPSDTALPDVAELLIAAMGWAGYHLWAFRKGRVIYDLPDPDWPRRSRDATRHTLDDLLPTAGSRAVLEYDFGDGWEHDVSVESVWVGPAEPAVLEGGRACPPEDVGGPAGYLEFLEAIADPSHPERDQMRTWAGEDFDPEQFDAQLASTGLRPDPQDPLTWV